MKKRSAKTKKTNDKTKHPVVNTDTPVEKTENSVVKTEKPAKRFKIPRIVRTWIKESQFLATTLSIILTFGTADVVDHFQRARDRKMSALMVLSNIENFSDNVDKMVQDVARCDTIGTWLLSLPTDSLDKIDPKEVEGIINDMLSLINNMSHDKTAENIFSNSFETWKNMGIHNYQFIDNVGATFSRMNSDENNWNEWVSEYEIAINKAISRIEPGEHTLTILLNDNVVRQKIESFHVRKSWLEFVSAHNRWLNKKNMNIMGIQENDVAAFAELHKQLAGGDDGEPTQPREPKLKPDSLPTLKPIIQHIDSIIHDK